MIAVDTNVLVAAHRADAAFHVVASRVMQTLAESNEPWALPWHCLVEFTATVTNRRIWTNDPTPAPVATEQVGAWLRSPSVIALVEGSGFQATFTDVVISSGVTGPQVHDARIAALCIYHGVSELLTADRDFSRFPRLKTRNPLVG